MFNYTRKARGAVRFLYLRRIVMRKFAFFTFLVCSVCLCVPAEAAVILTPSNVQIPSSPGEIFSFDFVIGDPCGVSALTFKSEINTSFPGTLTLDETISEAVVGEAGYWIPAGLSLVEVYENLDGSYSFSDDPCSVDPCSISLTLVTGDIMARYAFEWDGTIGDYEISLNTNIANSYVFNFNTFDNVPLAINPGVYPGDASSFNVHIPEPATLMLFGLVGTVLLRKRRR
jgi:hypothetical protein